MRPAVSTDASGFPRLAVLGALWACSMAAGSACEIELPSSDNLSEPWKSNRAHGFAWFGSDELAAKIPEDGHWVGMGPEHDYGDKFWWWRKGYRAIEEQRPELVVTANRLDRPAPPVRMDEATNAFGKNWDLMLIGMEFPTAGCWEVIGRYHGRELRFVLKVGD